MSDYGSRSSRTTASSSMGSGVAIFVTVVALVLGFLILRKVNDTAPEGIKGGGGSETSVDETTAGTGDTTLTSETSTTAPVQNFTGTKVQVANSSVQNGVAKMMTTALLGAGFTTADATNGTADPKLATSKIIYNASDLNAKAVADTLSGVLGGLTVEAATVPLPVTSGSWADGSGVILLLGNDLAGKTLDQIAGQPATGVTGASSSTTG